MTIVASMFAALSGSSPAAGTIGVIIPPSIPFVIYGVAAQRSISGLFLAGIIPGIMIKHCADGDNYFTSKKHNYGIKKKFKAKNLFVTLRTSIWALLVPVIILGEIYGGIFTPTESAVVAIVYSLIVGCFIDNISSCVILTPILLPIVTGIGMSPILRYCDDRKPDHWIHYSAIRLQPVFCLGHLRCSGYKNCRQNFAHDFSNDRRSNAADVCSRIKQRHLGMTRLVPDHS